MHLFRIEFDCCIFGFGDHPLQAQGHAHAPGSGTPGGVAGTTGGTGDGTQVGQTQGDPSDSLKFRPSRQYCCFPTHPFSLQQTTEIMKRISPLKNDIYWIQSDDAQAPTERPGLPSCPLPAPPETRGRGSPDPRPRPGPLALPRLTSLQAHIRLQPSSACYPPEPCLTVLGKWGVQ